MVNNIVKKLEVFLQIAEKILLRYKTFKTYSSRHFPLLPSIEVSAEVHSQGLGHGGDENRTGKNGKHREDQQKDHGSVHEHVRIRGHFLPVSTIISHETQRQQIVDPPGLFPLQHNHQSQLRTDRDCTSNSHYIHSSFVFSCGHFCRHAGFTRLRTAFEYKARLEERPFVR